MQKDKSKRELTLFERVKSKVGWALYDLNVKLFHRNKSKKKKKTIQAQNRSHLIFCLVMIAIPVIQFIIFYVCVNINSIILAFQTMDIDGKREFINPLFENFRQLFYDFSHRDVYAYALKNSLKAYLITGLLPMPFALLFAYFIYKKAWGGKVFKIFLFLPSVVSSIIMVIMFQYMVDNAVPALLSKILNKTGIIGLYSNPETMFGTVMFYCIFTGFGPNVLVYLSAMNSINPSLVEACELDGASPFQEFIYLTFPLVYPTFLTFIVVGITTIFTNQLNLVSFMGTESPLIQYQTFGYFMYSKTVESKSNYPMLTSLGLLMTLIVAPTTIIIKKVLEKIGPSEV